ncbi:hypothetical protein ACQKND_04015 [Viridibacillus arvi]|uniref:hypothetical protein n=1 Tax=Viridibacillus arvi TaxID=263475 RepID=UPI003D05571A
MILKVIEEYLNGDKWEQLIVSCCRTVYREHDFQEVPAHYKGDSGIEGFTRNGIVIQCYCPDDPNLSINQLYENQREKVTDDINKLINLENAVKLQNLGVPEIKKWIFIVPEHKDRRILEHLHKKKQEVLRKKNAEPLSYGYISADFDCLIKVADDFRDEIFELYITKAMGKKINLPQLKVFNPNWDNVPSEKVENVKRKILSINPNLRSNPDFLDKLINQYMTLYVQGVQFMEKIGETFPEFRRDIIELKNTYKNEVESRSSLNFNHTLNNSVFIELQKEFTKNLEKEFSALGTSTLMSLTQSTTSEWLADCSLEFIGDFDE